MYVQTYIPCTQPSSDELFSGPCVNRHFSFFTFRHSRLAGGTAGVTAVPTVAYLQPSFQKVTSRPRMIRIDRRDLPPKEKKIRRKISVRRKTVGTECLTPPLTTNNTGDQSRREEYDVCTVLFIIVFTNRPPQASQPLLRISPPPTDR